MYCVTCLLVTFVCIVEAQLDLPPPVYDDYGDDRRRVVQPEEQEQQRKNSVNTQFEADIKRLLQALDVQASQQCTNNVAAQWNFENNVNEHTQLEAVSFSVENASCITTDFL